MLAFVTKNHALIAVSKPLPTLRPGWALVRVRLAGICNTDIEILRGYHNFRGTPGHEFVGEVVDVRGARSYQKKSWLGRRVAGDINIACAALGFHPPCEFCRRGLKTHCARRKVLGIVAHDGAFAEFLALPLENLHAIPNTVTDEEAVFIEPLAAACDILVRSSRKRIPQSGRTRRWKTRPTDRDGSRFNRHPGRDVGQASRKTRAGSAQRNQNHSRARHLGKSQGQSCTSEVSTSRGSDRLS